MSQAPQEPSVAVTYQTMLLSASIVLNTLKALGYKGALFGDVAAKLHRASPYDYPWPSTIVQILLMPPSSLQIISDPIHTILEKIVSSSSHGTHLTLVPNFLQPELRETSGIIRFEEPQSRTSCNILLVLPDTLGLPIDLTGGDLEWIMARVGHFSSSFLFQSRSQSQSTARLTTLPIVPLGVLLISALERWKEHKTKSNTQSVDMLLEVSWRRGTVGTVTRRDGQAQRVYELMRGWGLERRGRIAEIVQEFCNVGK